MNKKAISRIKSSKWLMYAVITVLMSIIFYYLYGRYILNPTYTDWLLKDAHYDLSQHYLGWKAYRAGKWTFPIGFTDYLAYPTKTSVIFTDSIPCLAVFFKILSPFLPEEFQYFGIWGIMCFILQGVLSARIISKFTDNKLLIVLTSILFAFTPAMIRKMYGHTALAGQWILLLALEPVFAHKSYAENKKIYTVWALVGLLASSIHIYFVLMCGIILLGYCIEDMLTYRRVKRSLLVLLTYVLSSGIVIGILGGFSSGISATAIGLGKLSLNLNALFNPQGWSCILPDLPLYADGQYEGFAYLGAGAIILLVVSTAGTVFRWKIKTIISNHFCEIFSLAIVFVITFAVALSPVVTLGDTVIFEISLPELIHKCWSAFRATGRIGWIITYTLILCSCVTLCRNFNKKTAVIILSICVAIQVYDLHMTIYDIHTKYSKQVIYKTVFTDFSDEIAYYWNRIGNNEEIKHIIFIEPISGKDSYAFTDWALSNGKTVNRFYFARSLDDDVINKNIQSALENPTNADVFLFPKANKMQCLKYNLNYYLVDDYIIGYTGTLENWDKLPEDYFDD